jgi:hypothetical protein
MPVTRAVVLVIDRLGAGWLGPYGNTWLDTPSINRLAAESALFETALSDSPDLEANCRSVWGGQHALRPNDNIRLDLASLAAGAGGSAVLLTDEPSVSKHPLASTFSERRILPTVEATSSADGIEQTGLFSFFDAARSAIQSSSSSRLLWLHSRGLSGSWDAPLELRYQFADDEDPEPPKFVEPPSRLLPTHHDPDEVLGYVQAYAGQVALADMCLALLLDALAEHPFHDETMFVVTSPRGYPLGEHQRVGSAEPALYSELLQVPLLIRVPGIEPMRVQRIFQPHQLPTFVARTCGWQSAERDLAALDTVEWFGQENGGVGYSIASGQRAIRTPAWFMRESLDPFHGPRHELFAKPDDRWEANEVSSRCTEATELLAAELARFETSGRGQGLAETPPLPEILCDVWR